MVRLTVADELGVQRLLQGCIYFGAVLCLASTNLREMLYLSAECHGHPGYKVEIFGISL
jgi:hypothetical protein